MTSRPISLAPFESNTGPGGDAIATIANIVERLLGIQPASVRRMAGGGNNKLFKFEGTNGECVVAKQYFRHSSDGTNRLDAEFGGLGFLWRHGMRRIAKPLACDRDIGVAVYQYVGGAPANSRLPGAADVAQAAAFLRRLRGLAELPKARTLPAAAEACFSLEELLDNLTLRLSRLSGVAPKSRLFEELCALRDDEIAPALEKLAASARIRRQQSGQNPRAALDPSRRTLSPSDFGFHNAIRQQDDTLIFVDFEYFGWDDPAKTISDFLLHPAMELTHAQGEEFFSQCLEDFSDPDLASRTRAYFPLFGLKWVFITLNEFSPDGWQRRVFSGLDDQSAEAHLRGQLNKAKNFLNNAIRANEEFTYAA